MANRKELKECPFGCPRTSTSPLFVNSETCGCEKCGTRGPSLRVVMGSAITRYPGDVRKEGALLLWNARSKSDKDNLVQLMKDPTFLTRLYDAKRKGKPLAEIDTGKGGQWMLCVESKDAFVEGVEYKVQPSSEKPDELVLATDSEGGRHQMPARLFQPA